MGCFNQVCLLTRAPITCGDEVVVWEEIKGPWFNPGNSGHSHGLLFGLPQRAHYDDYGGAESYADEKLQKFHDKAWEKQTLYRTHKVKGSYETRTLYIAATAETMSKTHGIATFFYGEQELNPKDVFEAGYEEAFTQKRGRAEARAKTVLANIGRRIGEAKLPKEEVACMTACFHIVQEEVGPALAWAVWEVISKGELFATRELCMMRAEAYDYLVNTVGADTVSQYEVPNSKRPFRQFLQERWDAWEVKRAGVTSKNALIAQMQLKDHYLMPMAVPWEIAEQPIEAFFWNAIGYDELIKTVGRDAFLDAIVFRSAWGYLRTSLHAEPGGGQHEDWKLHQGVMKAVYAKAREEGTLKRDWYGYI